MANEEQLAILRQGVDVWNQWREKEPTIKVDLIGANLREANLSQVNLDAADLGKANLRNANLRRARLRTVNLRNANLMNAELLEANLMGADLRETLMVGADLRGAKLIDADLRGAFLGNSNLVRADISNAKISKSNVYGISVWDIKGKFKEQEDLIITPMGSRAPITVDNIKVAQFIYLILNNEEIRNVINALTSKTVLILGRFSILERKNILDALRNKLREYDLLPIVFDFERPADRNFTETVQTLAGLSYFVIADITNPKSSPLELQSTIPDLLVPCVPIIQEGEIPFAMIEGLQQRPWVLDTISYDSLETLIAILKPHIIDPAMKKHDELRKIKANVPTVISGRELKEKK